MNLSLNLIEEQEKRHGGSLTTLFLLRAVAIAIPLIILLFVAHLLITLRLEKTQLARTEERISDKQPQLAISAQIMKQRNLYRQMLGQLSGWNAVRLEWSRELDLVRQTVPLEVQITSLQLKREMTFSNNTPRVSYSLFLSGKTGGAQPEANLTRFRQSLSRNAALTNTLASVEVPEGAFVEDTSPDARPTDRLFRLNGFFIPREIK